eukprot:6212301-Pleurochrysis_carterae.AAC.1
MARQQRTGTSGEPACSRPRRFPVERVPGYKYRRRCAVGYEFCVRRACTSLVCARGCRARAQGGARRACWAGRREGRGRGRGDAIAVRLERQLAVQAEEEVSQRIILCDAHVEKGANEHRCSMMDVPPVLESLSAGLVLANAYL